VSQHAVLEMQRWMLGPSPQARIVVRGFASTAQVMARTYKVIFAIFTGCAAVTTDQDAVESLNTLQSNSAIVEAIRKSGRSMNEQAIPEMIEWCHKIGYKVSQH
jgi:hypothetical protein